MKIGFAGRVNCDQMMVNVAEFQMSDGTIITVDRDTTEYTIEEDGTFTMQWLGCYIWDGVDPIYEFPESFYQAKFIRLEVEDDAPDGYDIKVVLAAPLV